MAIDLTTIRNRVSSICAKKPYSFTQATTPFSFDLQPAGELDKVFRIETASGETVGGFSYSEERTDVLQIWVARKYAGDPEAAYRALVTDASSLRASVVRDGSVTSGEYMAPDEGAGMSVQRDPGNSFGVLRVTVPVNFMTTV